MKKAKYDFEKDCFKLINNAVFGKAMENVRKHRDIELATTEGKRNYLVLVPNYQKVFHRISISKRNEKNADSCE